MLFARCEREHVASSPFGIGRLADDPPWHATNMLGAAGKKAIMRAAERLRVARALTLASGDRTAITSRCFEHAEGDWIDVRDRHRTRVDGRCCEVRRRLETPEEVRLLKDHRSSVRCGGGDRHRIGRAVRMGDLDDLETEARGVCLDDLAHLRVHGLTDDDPAPSRDVLRHVAGVSGHGRAVVPGRVGDVHARELADCRLVLEDRLENPLAQLGLVWRVRREELASLEDRVDDGGHVVVIDARTEERQLAARVGVASRELCEVRNELRFGERRLEVERPLKTHALRDVPKELFDGRDADRREHLLSIRARQ